MSNLEKEFLETPDNNFNYFNVKNPRYRVNTVNNRKRTQKLAKKLGIKFNNYRSKPKTKKCERKCEPKCEKVPKKCKKKSSKKSQKKCSKISQKKCSVKCEKKCSVNKPRRNNRSNEIYIKKGKRFRIHKVAEDGNCQFHAVIKALKKKGKGVRVPVNYKEILKQGREYEGYRNYVNRYINETLSGVYPENYIRDYKNHVMNLPIEPHVYLRIESVNWIKKNINLDVWGIQDIDKFYRWWINSEWGDNITLIGISNLFNLKINVVPKINMETQEIIPNDQTYNLEIYIILNYKEDKGVMQGMHYEALTPL